MRVGASFSGASGLAVMAASIRRYPEQAQAAGVAAANDLVRSIMVEAPRDITDELNLTPSYVKGNFRFVLADVGRQEAVVSARRRPVRLARFDAQQITVAAPGAKGDKLRKIGSGRKQAGISVKVKRGGSRKVMRGVFFLPLRAGKVDGGNGFGIFFRHGKDIGQDYGPSTDQSFRYWIDRNRERLQEKLATGWMARLQREIRRSS